MNCGMECIKYLIFIFNFVFALGGLAIMVLGVLIKLKQGEILSVVEDNVPLHLSMPASVLIAVGAIIFIIAFFGCCGAARESHCMIVTFAVLLLALLVIQVVIAAFAFIEMKDGKFDTEFNEKMEKLFDKSMETSPSPNDPAKAARTAVNAIQSLASCCGYDNYNMYDDRNSFYQGRIPYSCCDKKEGEFCSKVEVKDKRYNVGCKDKVVPYIHTAMDTLGGLALGIAAVELIGVIFSFCLANSIRNVERRGYKV